MSSRQSEIPPSDFAMTRKLTFCQLLLLSMEVIKENPDIYNWAFKIETPWHDPLCLLLFLQAWPLLQECVSLKGAVALMKILA